MASIDLSSNSREITSAYDAIVHGDPKVSWAVFTYGAGFNNGSLKLQSTGSGDLDEVREEFSDGKVQYAFVRVTDRNSQLKKFVLIGWCGDGVPERAKGYFPSHFASVARLFHGYHVQITARSDDDVDPEAILKKVEDAAGAKYSVSEISSRFSKAPRVRPAYTATHSTSHADESDWGDAPPVTKTEVTKEPPAWKPVKVDLDAIRKSSAEERKYVEPVRSSYQPIGKVDVSAIRAAASKKELESEKPEVVSSAYKPIGKVDIAAIRSAASQKELQSEKPEVVKSSYEPIGKVDLNAIRAQAKQSESYSSRPEPSATKFKPDEPEAESPSSFNDRAKAFTAEPVGRLYELPKPKVNKPALASRFGGAASFGTAPSLPVDQFKAAPKVSLGFNDFANEGGKTPAQIWAERKAKASGGSSTSSSASTATKSFGSTWSAPTPSAPAEAEKETSGVAAMRERFARSSISHDNEDEDEEEQEKEEPPRPSSPIRLANPVSSSSTIIRPGAVPARSVPAREPSPEPTYEEEEEEHAPAPPALDYSSKPSGRPFPTAPKSEPEYEPEPEPEYEPEPEPEPEQEQEPAPEPEYEDEPEPVSDFQQRRAAAAAALASGGVVGAPAPARQAAPEPEPEATTGTGKTAIVLYEYVRDEDNELSLVEGEIVYDVEMIDDGWWAGRKKSGEHGLFPSNYVELQEGPTSDAPVAVAPTSPAAVEAEIPKGPSAVAAFDYEAQEDNELSFPEGAVIEDIQFPDEDWWSGVYNGERKLFPANYVSLQ